MAERKQARVGNYPQRSIRARLEAFFLDNLGRVATQEQVQEVARDPKTGKVPARWHQRISELRTDLGYTILSARDRKGLGVSEYMMPHAQKRNVAGRRVQIGETTWKKVLDRAGHACEWDDSGKKCGLQGGQKDPIGGGTVRLTPDHKRPHSVDPRSDPNDPDAWQALCGRHQVVKKNFWDHATGKMNAYAIVQAAPDRVKHEIYEFLRAYFGA